MFTKIRFINTMDMSTHEYETEDPTPYIDFFVKSDMGQEAFDKFTWRTNDAGYHKMLEDMEDEPNEEFDIVIRRRI